MEFITKNGTLILLILFLASELLASISPNVIAANSVFQAIRNFLRGESKKSLPEIENRIGKEE